MRIPETLRVSNAITRKYFEVEDMTFGMLLQLVARGFKGVRSSIEISYLRQAYI